MMKPRLLDKHHVVNNELRQLIRNCKNLVPDLEQVAQLFEQDTFMRRVLHSGSHQGEGEDDEGSRMESEIDDLWDKQTSYINKEDGASSGVADKRSEGVNDKEQEALVMTEDTPTEDTFLAPERHLQGLDTRVRPVKPHLKPWTFQADNLEFQAGEDVKEPANPTRYADLAYDRGADLGGLASNTGNDVPDRAHLSL